MTMKKGARFTHNSGNRCFISNVKKDEVRISFVDDVMTAQVWTKDDFEEAVKTSIFIPVLKPPVINRDTITLHLIEYQLNMVGKDLKDAYGKDKWYSDFSMTQQQHELFKGYAIPLIKKVFKCTKKKAEHTFSWFNLMYGLRVEQKTKENE